MAPASTVGGAWGRAPDAEGRTWITNLGQWGGCLGTALRFSAVTRDNGSHMLEMVLRALFLLAQQSPAPETPKPAQVEQQPVQVKRTDLNLLGATDSSAGESRRNENVQFNLIDNNSLKYLNIRLGTNAAIVTEFRPERKYFGTE